MRSRGYCCLADFAANEGKTFQWHGQFLLVWVLLIIFLILWVVKNRLMKMVVVLIHYYLYLGKSLGIILNFRPSRKITHVNNSIPNFLWVVHILTFFYFSQDNLLWHLARLQIHHFQDQHRPSGQISETNCYFTPFICFFFLHLWAFKIQRRLRHPILALKTNQKVITVLLQLFCKCVLSSTACPWALGATPFFY